MSLRAKNLDEVLGKPITLFVGAPGEQPNTIDTSKPYKAYKGQVVLGKISVGEGRKRHEENRYFFISEDEKQYRITVRGNYNRVRKSQDGKMLVMSIYDCTNGLWPQDNSTGKGKKYVRNR